MDDPKKLPTLDPKLKETYERVMGFTPPTGAPVAPTPSAPSPITPPVTTAPQPAAPVPPPATQIKTMGTPQTQPVVPVQNAMTPAPAQSAYPSVISTSSHMTNPIHEKSSGVMPALIIFGGLTFFVIYTLFWMKFFNVALPFLPQ